VLVQADGIAIAPILVIYLIFRHYLVSSLTAGAVRGS
jgi:ABC-type glycerol-3-phosphate transport system permease component